ncbi:MAG: CBS domain-containing protein, partial [Actinomycetota bacterium]
NLALQSGWSALDQAIDQNPLRVAPGMAVIDAIAQMNQRGASCALVMAENTLVGIFTERDLMLRVVHAGRDPALTTMRAVMTTEPDTIAAEAPVAHAIRAMDELSYRYLPVLDGDRCVGVISTRHVPLSDVLELKDELQARHDIAERMW